MLMKSFFNHLKVVLPIISFSYLLLPAMLPAAEILHEQGWIRIISGDRATCLTREIGEQSQPTQIDENTIKQILKDMGLPSQNSTQIEAWQTGLKKYGWAI